jgi:hypothetical protein
VQIGGGVSADCAPVLGAVEHEQFWNCLTLFRKKRGKNRFLEKSEPKILEGLLILHDFWYAFSKSVKKR